MMEAIRNATIDFTDLLAEKMGAYMDGTRLWCFDDAKAWIDGDHQQGSFLFWLMGGAGTGKSVVSAMLIKLITRKEKPLVEADVVWHFCLHTNPADNTPFRIMSSLAAQLCEVDSDFKAALESQERVADAFSGQLSTMEMFDVVIKTPLASLGERKRPILIIIDALDELQRDRRATCSA